MITIRNVEEKIENYYLVVIWQYKDGERVEEPGTKKLFERNEGETDMDLIRRSFYPISLYNKEEEGSAYYDKDKGKHYIKKLRLIK